MSKLKAFGAALLGAGVGAANSAISQLGTKRKNAAADAVKKQQTAPPVPDLAQLEHAPSAPPDYAIARAAQIDTQTPDIE